MEERKKTAEGQAKEETPHAEQKQNPFWKADHRTDVVFTVEDRQIHFNRAVLSLHSPVFDRMLYGDFVEKNAKDIPMPGKKFDDMVEFFKQLHPAHANSSAITNENLVSLLELAREYQVSAINIKCDQYIGAQVELRILMRNGPTEHQLLLFLYACEQFGFETHLPKLKDLASKRRCSDLKASENYSRFTHTALTDVLEMRCKALEKDLARCIC